MGLFLAYVHSCTCVLRVCILWLSEEGTGRDQFHCSVKNYLWKQLDREGPEHTALINSVHF